MLAMNLTGLDDNRRTEGCYRLVETKPFLYDFIFDPNPLFPHEICELPAGASVWLRPTKPIDDLARKQRGELDANEWLRSLWQSLDRSGQQQSESQLQSSE